MYWLVKSVITLLKLKVCFVEVGWWYCGVSAEAEAGGGEYYLSRSRIVSLGMVGCGIGMVSHTLVRVFFDILWYGNSGEWVVWYCAISHPITSSSLALSQLLCAPHGHLQC